MHLNLSDTINPPTYLPYLLTLIPSIRTRGSLWSCVCGSHSSRCLHTHVIRDHRHGMLLLLLLLLALALHVSVGVMDCGNSPVTGA